MGDDIAPVTGSTLADPAATPLCTCYCLAAWGAPLAAPDIDDPGMPTTAIAAGPPITETETTTGTTYWTATVNVKTYVCKTPKVVKTATDTPNLAHNTYAITRTRVLGPTTVTVLGVTVTIGPWLVFGVPVGTWGPWTPPARVNSAPLPAAQALASAAPPMTPVCTSVGVVCP